MHWADHTAQVLKKKGGSQVVASGITPSGEFHIGHLREILTAEMIHRACLDSGMKSRYIFIVDSMDPLRRVYDFLGDSYGKYIGHPLAYIPAPNDDGEPGSTDMSYADFFLRPFLEALKHIGVEPEVVMNHETYENGDFAEAIDSAIKNMDEIYNIIETISGRSLPSNWFPYNPLGSDGSMDEVTVTGYEFPYVSWIDRHGVEGSSDIRKGEGKLPWRIDWAAKWATHGISCEPAGKDHGAAGGSFDTGIPICKILGGNPPDKMVYEWIQLKGMGPMSSSKGVTIGPMEALALVPAEIMRFVIARSKVNRHIEFNTGEALFEIADEYERLVSNPPKSVEGETRRMEVARETNLGAIRLSQITRGSEPSDSIAGVSFRHLSMLAQIKSDDDEVWSSLKRTGHLEGEANEALRQRLSRMRNWIEGPHFPQDSRITVRNPSEDRGPSNLEEGQMDFLNSLVGGLRECQWDEGSIEVTIRAAASESLAPLKECYSSLYLSIIGKDRGPKIASIIAEIGRDDVIELISSN